MIANSVGGFWEISIYHSSELAAKYLSNIWSIVLHRTGGPYLNLAGISPVKAQKIARDVSLLFLKTWRGPVPHVNLCSTGPATPVSEQYCITLFLYVKFTNQFFPLGWAVVLIFHSLFSPPLNHSNWSKKYVPYLLG